jgi:hypothetical protein
MKIAAILIASACLIVPAHAESDPVGAALKTQSQPDDCSGNIMHASQECAAQIRGSNPAYEAVMAGVQTGACVFFLKTREHVAAVHATTYGVSDDKRVDEQLRKLDNAIGIFCK